MDSKKKDAKLILETIEWWEKESDELIMEIDFLESQIESGNYSSDVKNRLDDCRKKLGILIRRGQNEYSEVCKLTGDNK